MATVRSSLALSALNSYFGLVLQIAMTAYVARVLSPYEVGVFAVGAVFMAIASNLRDFGVAEYMVQCSTVDAAVLRASLAVNLAASWSMALAMWAASPWVAAFYGSDGVGQVMRVQAIGLLLIPFGAVTLAWFRREMDFRPILLANVVGSVASAVVTVGLVWAGAGYIGLAWGGVAGIAGTVAVAVIMRPAWFPRTPAWAGSRAILRFGGYASGVFVTTQIGRGAPDLVVGRVGGLADAGMFSRAHGMVEMFNQLVVRAVQPVCLPYLAEGARRDGSVVPSLLRAMTLLTGVGWPCLALLALAAFPAIRLIYGPQWVEAVPIAQVLCLAAAIELAHRFANQTLFSIGKAREAHRLQMLVQGLRVAGVLAVVPYGLPGAAGGLALAAIGGLWASQRALARHAGLRLAATWSALAPSLVLTILSTLPVALLVGLVPPGESNWLAIGSAAAALSAASWTLCAWYLGHPVWDEARRAVRTAAAWRTR
jgi:O-antigen/teichoic acid export membrane protein